jgi:hypothetical protein
MEAALVSHVPPVSHWCTRPAMPLSSFSILGVVSVAETSLTLLDLHKKEMAKRKAKQDDQSLSSDSSSDDDAESLDTEELVKDIKLKEPGAANANRRVHSESESRTWA